MTAAALATTGLLFAAGLAMIVLRRELLAMLLGLELMIAAVNLALVSAACLYADAGALSAVLLVIAVAACEAVVGLSLILRLHGAGRAVESGALTELRG